MKRSICFIDKGCFISKSVSLIIIIPILLVLFHLSCKKILTKETTNELSLVKTEFTDCYKEISYEEKSYFINTEDPISYSLYGDTLKLSLSLNYNCCGSLKDSIYIGDCYVELFIEDICESNCLCYCTCKYQFDFYLKDYKWQDLDLRLFVKYYNDLEFSLKDELLLTAR